MPLITKDIKKIFKALKPDECRIVGGAVRDFIINGHIADDIDIATTALPKHVMQELKKHGMKVIASGLKHGTVTVVYNNKHYEITTLRNDITTDGRHANVSFTNKFKEDAKRRDFTFNAMYMDEQGDITDYFDGEVDLKNADVRFIGNPEERIDEDYLRILRYFRFHGKFTKKPNFNEKTLGIIKIKAVNIQKLSAERITSEVFKILSSQHAHLIWQKMEEVDICKNIGFNKADINRFKNLNKLFPKQTNPLTILVCLYHGESLHGLKLVFSNKEKSYLNKLNKALVLIKNETNYKILAYRLGKDIYLSALKIEASSKSIANLELIKTIKQVNEFNIPTFPIDGEDLIEHGYNPSPKIGEVLQELENWWLANNFPDKSACLKQLEPKI